ncbi:MAG: tetratricopeptide repeat protein [Gammaproteobacteria bacterium]|nr:tetratricopeptide repeat protein [Gammaproteobacteria bacterium]
MDTFRSEDEQVQALRKWWSENGASTVVTVCVALAVVFGWRGWQNQQQAKLDAAAFAYQNLLEAVAVAEQQPDDIKIASAVHLADTIKQDFGNTGYAHFAALFKARQAVADEDYSSAEAELRWVLEHAPTPQLQAIAELRLARVLYAAGDASQALELLQNTSVDAEADVVFVPQRAELAGDIYMSQGDYESAYDSYLLAQTSAVSAGVTVPPMLNTKLSYAKSYR